MGGICYEFSIAGYTNYAVHCTVIYFISQNLLVQYHQSNQFL